MKIAFDHQIFCNQRFGGISRYFCRLAESLADEGANTKVFAPFHRNEYLASLSSHLVSGRYVGDYPANTNRAIYFLNEIFAKRKIRKFMPDFVHETYYRRSLSGGFHFPTVLTVFDMIHERLPHVFAPTDSTAERKKAAIERAAHIICISEYTRQDLIEILNVREEKVSVVYLGFDDLERIPKSEVHTIIPSRDFILFVGRRDGYKNFRTLLDAYVSSETIHSEFDLIAFGGGPFSNEESRLIGKSGRGHKAVRQITGGDALLSDLYRNARAFVYPSTYEGFGLPPLEAMAHDCPVISSRASCMPEIIGDAAEFFDPLSQEDLRNALEHVLYSSSRATELIHLGRKRLGGFSWDKCASQTRAVYEAISCP